MNNRELDKLTEQVMMLQQRVDALERENMMRLDTLSSVNALIAIHPYKHNGQWVFDDPQAGLVQEPFVSGADEIIERMVHGMSGAQSGFTLLFSAAPFPGHQSTFEWRRTEMGGNWYYSADLDIEGWLCPALFKYFDVAPERIYAQFKARTA